MCADHLPYLAISAAEMGHLWQQNGDAESDAIWVDRRDREQIFRWREIGFESLQSARNTMLLLRKRRHDTRTIDVPQSRFVRFVGGHEDPFGEVRRAGSLVELRGNG